MSFIQESVTQRAVQDLNQVIHHFTDDLKRVVLIPFQCISMGLHDVPAQKVWVYLSTTVKAHSAKGGFHVRVSP